MLPQYSQVFNQKLWPQVGDYDDCWAVSDLMAVHSVAPWLSLPGMTAYRAAAGAPDDPNASKGGTVSQSVQAIKTLYPRLAIEFCAGWSWTNFIAKVKDGHPASVSLKSGLLPLALQYGFTGNHRVMVVWNGTTLKVLNPLAKAHSKSVSISEADLQKAVLGYDVNKIVWAVLMPTVEQAFKTHPLYPLA